MLVGFCGIESLLSKEYHVKPILFDHKRQVSICYKGRTRNIEGPTGQTKEYLAVKRVEML